VIRAAMEQQGEGIGVERMCVLAGVGRAGYYRHWLASKPREEETALRDEIQRLSLVHRKNGYRHNGYRLITVLLHRAGWAVNHKRVARIRREDNLLCVPKLSFRPATTDSRHGWRVWPNLARHLVPMAVNQLWVADLMTPLIYQTGPKTSANSGWSCSMREKRCISGRSLTSGIIGIRS
jgi:hypothetical protein